MNKNIVIGIGAAIGVTIWWCYKKSKDTECSEYLPPEESVKVARDWVQEYNDEIRAKKQEAPTPKNDVKKQEEIEKPIILSDATRDWVQKYNDESQEVLDSENRRISIRPYIISKHEFVNDEKNKKLFLIYFKDNDVLIDPDNDIVLNKDVESIPLKVYNITYNKLETLKKKNFGNIFIGDCYIFGSMDAEKDTMYVRNDLLGLDIEVTRVKKAYEPMDEEEEYEGNLDENENGYTYESVEEEEDE